MLVIIQTMPRAERGIGALTIAVDGHWNSRMAGNVGSRRVQPLLARQRQSVRRVLGYSWGIRDRLLGPGSVLAHAAGVATAA